VVKIATFAKPQNVSGNLTATQTLTNIDKVNNLEFKKKAKQHQVNYREKHISPDYNTYVTWLTDEAGNGGRNFFDGFGVFEAVQQRYPKFYVDLYSDMLRSEHIPFNLFVPFKHDLTFCKNVFNEILGGCIKSIDKQAIIDRGENIKIEFAPSPKENYLNDRTSFDTYIEYTHQDNSKGIICIEVKYTEKEYKLEVGSTQEKTINDKSSKYFSVSKDCGLYEQTSMDLMLTDIFRQVWRNQLLAESIRLVHNDKFKYSSSLTFYPEGNGHFTDTSEKYIAMLLDNKNTFVPVTYENFLIACLKHCPNNDFKKWIDYLTDRYIVSNG